MKSGRINSFKEAIQFVFLEVRGFLQRAYRSTSVFKPLSWIAPLLFGVAGFLSALLIYGRGFRDSVLFATHCALALPTAVAGLVIITAALLVFTSVQEGLFNQLADQWTERYQRKHSKQSVEIPYYRFMLPATLAAAFASLLVLSLFGLLTTIVSAFSPPGLPSLFVTGGGYD